MLCACSLCGVNKGEIIMYTVENLKSDLSTIVRKNLIEIRISPVNLKRKMDASNNRIQQIKQKKSGKGCFTSNATKQFELSNILFMAGFFIRSTVVENYLTAFERCCISD